MAVPDPQPDPVDAPICLDEPEELDIHEEAVKAALSPVTAGVVDVLAALDIGHPSGPALRALALCLANATASPLADADPRVLVAVSRELRETLDQLAPPAKGGESDVDPFGLADLRPTLVHTEAG